MRAPAADSVRFIGACALGAVGAALLCVAALHFRVDAPAPRDPRFDLFCASVYLVAVALLALAWRAAVRARPSPRAALIGGIVVHLVALLSPPFLSLDVLCYAAIGRAMAQYHASPYRALVESLPAGDPLLTRLPELWRTQGSAYSPVFNAVAAHLARHSGDDVARLLRSLQLVACAAIVATAWLTGVAVGVRHPERRGQTTALVLFCPLAIVEATVNAHNDALVAALVAGFVVAVELRDRVAGLGLLVAAAAVKLSALLLVVFRATELVVARVGTRVSRRACAIGFGVVATVGLGALLLLRSRVPSLTLMLALVGSPDEAPHCTRSIECVPRAILFWKLGAPAAAWLVGLVVRNAGGVWLIFAGWRAAAAHDRGATLRWAALALFVYYLALHGYMQSWYLLPLLPLLPFASPGARPAIAVFCLTALVYYAIRLPLQDDVRPAVVAARELAEAIVLIVPPALVWRAARVRDAVPVRRALVA